MRVLSLFALVVMISASFSAKSKAPARRMQDPVTASAAMAVLGELAKKTTINFDLNNAVDDLKSAFASRGTDSAYIINLDKDKQAHTFHCMPNVVNLGGLIDNDMYCTSGSTRCPCSKQWFPMADNQILVRVDGKHGGGKYEGRDYHITSGKVYNWDGEGFNLMGTAAGWIKALDNKPLAKRRLADTAAPTDAASATSIVKSLAENTNIKVDLNKFMRQLADTLKSTGSDEAIILNMDKVGHTFYCMPNVMDLWGLIKQANYAGPGNETPCKKQWMPLADNLIKVGIDGVTGAGKYAGRKYMVTSNMVYSFDGEGLSMHGSRPAWEKATAELHGNARRSALPPKSKLLAKPKLSTKIAAKKVKKAKKAKKAAKKEAKKAKAF